MEQISKEQLRTPAWKAILISAGFLVAILLGARILASTLGGFQEKVPFDLVPRETLIRSRPEIVFIGNSLLKTRIHQKKLERLIGKRVGLVAQHGSMSARWYLFLKNYVSAVKPKKVVIFFRDDELTRPRYRTDGRYRLFVEAASKESEPLLAEKLKVKGEFGPLKEGIQQLFPTTADSYRIQDNALTKYLSALLGEKEFLKAQKYQKPFFEISKLRADIKADDTFGAVYEGEFAKNLEGSFLPEFFKLAEEGGYSLIFYRVKRQVNYQQPDPERIVSYIADLRAYLNSKGALLVDETETNDVPLRFFRDGDHIGRAHQKKYTEIFAKRMVGVL